jgi:hypothetical protein
MILTSTWKYLSVYAKCVQRLPVVFIWRMNSLLRRWIQRLQQDVYTVCPTAVQEKLPHNYGDVDISSEWSIDNDLLGYDAEQFATYMLTIQNTYCLHLQGWRTEWSQHNYFISLTAKLYKEKLMFCHNRVSDKFLFVFSPFRFRI